jgi:hypothetical protein
MTRSDIIAQKLAKKKEVKIVEASIKTPKGNILKPDLVVLSQGSAHG